MFLFPHHYQQWNRRVSDAPGCTSRPCLLNLRLSWPSLVSSAYGEFWASCAAHPPVFRMRNKAPLCPVCGVFFPLSAPTLLSQFSGQPSRMSLNWCWSSYTLHCWLRFSSSPLSSLQQQESCLPGSLHLSHTLSIGLVPVLFLLPDKFPWTVLPSQDASFVPVAKEGSPWVTPPSLHCFISFSVSLERGLDLA